MQIQKIKKYITNLILYAFILANLIGPSAYSMDLVYNPFANLWNQLTVKFHLLEQYQEHKAVTKQVKIYAKAKEYMSSLTENAEPYLYYVTQELEKNHLPAELALLPMIESDYKPFVYSHVGAVGFWQLMPGTASGTGVKINWWFDGRRDIVESTQAAIKYLQRLHNQFHDWLLVLAAYNAGEGKVQAAIRHNQKLHKPTDYWSLHLPRETEEYVPKLLAFAKLMKEARSYNIKVKNVSNQPYFSIVDLHNQIDIEQVAKFAQIDINVLRHLNPGFRRWVTPPGKNGHYRLLIPHDKMILFASNFHLLEKLPVWHKHTVKEGETVNSIARTYSLNIETIININNLRHKRVALNQDLLIPLQNHTKDSDSVKLEKKITGDSVPGPKVVTHVVAYNDTLKSIAKQYHAKIGDIQYWNQLKDNDKLVPNQQLTLWLAQNQSNDSRPHKHGKRA